MGRVSARRYELVFSDGESYATGDGEGAIRDAVVVERTEATGPGGHPVYADATGIIRAEISDRDEVRMLASGGHQETPQRVVARPLPQAPDAGAAPDAA
ncbi:DUF6296 family protein [Streptomyces sp. NPDC048623]|uniref:DUF6296 family protein n=1 Tax=Streptomyces sp. NPDC048623 TaxID=3155761 RepID=UPI003414859B